MTDGRPHTTHSHACHGLLARMRHEAKVTGYYRVSRLLHEAADALEEYAEANLRMQLEREAAEYQSQGGEHAGHYTEAK